MRTRGDLSINLSLGKSGLCGNPVSIEQIDHIVRALFARHPVRVDVNRAQSVQNCPLFTIISSKKQLSPGPDGIPAEVSKLVFHLLFKAFIFFVAKGGETRANQQKKRRP